ncbi:MAG: rhodanese-like domain-containing protein [Leeuwenhoekiella sp.]
MKNITQEQWEKTIAEDKDAVILDVRTQEEVDGGIIGNSKHLDIYKGQGFIDEVQKLDKSKNYYIYCRSGNRSGQACQIMDQLGFSNTYNLVGGFNEWDGDVAYSED